MVTDTPFEAIYTSYKELVYNLALQYVQQANDAQDITQEVFVKVYRQHHRYDPATASLKTWIYRIAISQCLDFLKARRRKKRLGQLTGLFRPGSTEPIAEAVQFNHPGVAAEDKEDLQRLFALINGLPDNQKTVLILLKIEDRSQKEVAEIMQVSSKAVESLFQRAKQNLFKKLHPEQKESIKKIV